jgi:hypothetical protein
MLFELFICAWHNPPGISDRILFVDQMGKKLRYSFSTYVTAFMLIRVYLVMRLFTRFSVYRSAFADKCCANVGIEADTGFSLKCIYLDNPF